MSVNAPPIWPVELPTIATCPHCGASRQRLPESHGSVGSGWFDCSSYAFGGKVEQSNLCRIAELENAIRTHRDQKADDRCWMDDADLYKVLGDGVEADIRVGNFEVMHQNCWRFLLNRCREGGPWVSYAELEAQLAAANETVRRWERLAMAVLSNRAIYLIGDKCDFSIWKDTDGNWRANGGDLEFAATYKSVTDALAAIESYESTKCGSDDA